MSQRGRSVRAWASRRKPLAQVTGSAVLVALVCVLAPTGCSTAVERSPADGGPAPTGGQTPTGGDPLPGEDLPSGRVTADDPAASASPQFYADPGGAAATALRAAEVEGREDDVEAITRLQEPTATWFAHSTEDPEARAQALTRRAAAAGQVPVVVLYNIPGRDCGLYSGGGLPDARAYTSWVRRIGEAIGDRPTLVILEPDAVPHAIEGCEGLASPEERYGVLAEAVDILGQQPETRVYLDAGNASWVDDTAVLAEALRASGVGRADGFALNVSNFETTEASVEYGHRLSDQLAGARFVIDTSRNGAGPAPEDGTDHSWCNPRGRRLGSEPTSEPGIDRVDALLWVKQPGDSDGSCRPGEPPAGQFWPEYARELVG